MICKSLFLVLGIFSLPIFAGQKISCTSPFPQQASLGKQMQFIRQYATYATSLAVAIHDDRDKKACFSKSGWHQYQFAWQQSGNLNTIERHQFQSSMDVNGHIGIKADNKHHTWTLELPITLAYQNRQLRIKQHLKVLMLLKLKRNGRLAVMQIVGRPANMPALAT